MERVLTCRAKNIPISGPIIKEKAMKFAGDLQYMYMTFIPNNYLSVSGGGRQTVKTEYIISRHTISLALATILVVT